MKRRSFAAALLLLFAPLATGDTSNDASTFGSVPTHKAIATSIDDAAVRGITSSQSSDQDASLTALKRCESARTLQAGVCEITQLNDIAVTTARAIRSRVPAKTHPLFIWRFQAGASTVFLAGSIHVMKASLFPLPTQFEAAFQRADRLVIEVNTDAVEPAMLREKFLEYAVLPNGQSLGTALTPSTLASVSAHLQAQSMTLASVASLKPAMLATQLAVARLSALGYLPEFGLERHFMDAAGARPILELETIDQQLAVLTSPPMPVQDEMLAETIDQMDAIEPIISAMIVAWLAGDEREFRRLFDLESGDSLEVQAFMRRLLEDRNVGMADKIASYLQMPGTTFVLVGAAHLTGLEGIVALLEARGLKGRRINSNDTL
jgi:uncharacterized protein YbaP (TraB family)